MNELFPAQALPECYPDCDESGVYHAKSGMNYSFLFFYERKFFNITYIKDTKVWVDAYWPVSIQHSCMYLACIFLGQLIMKNREKFDLRRGLIAWNTLLCAFSLMGCYRLWPEFIHAIQRHGLDHSYCVIEFVPGITGAWITFFCASKFPELFDTFFIVARKQNLIFLHWFHHATVLVYCWYSIHQQASSGLIFALMNFQVHAIMYGYYACRAMRFNIPKWISMCITAGQISQMVVGIYINSSAFLKKRRGLDCGISDSNIAASFLMYLAYFLLFSLFFLRTYVSGGGKSSKLAKKTL